MSGPVDDDNTMLVSGAYECVAENDIGVGTSESLEVRVLCKLLSIIRYRAESCQRTVAKFHSARISPLLVS